MRNSKLNSPARLLTGITAAVAAMALTLSPAIAMADTPTTSAPKQPAAGQSATQMPAPGQQTLRQEPTTPETRTPAPAAPATPSAQDETPYACTEGTSTFKDCFPDAAFRAYLARAYPFDSNSSNSNNPGNKFDNSVVTAAWAGRVDKIDGSGLGAYGLGGASQISDIRGIQLFTNLSTFTAASRVDHGFSAVTDYSPMSHLANLTTVNLAYIGNNVPGDVNNAKLSTWTSANMPALTSLNLEESSFWDVSQLAGLSNLTSLNLNRNLFGKSGTAAGAPDDKGAFRNFNTMFPNLRQLDVGNDEALHEDTNFDVLTLLPHLTDLDASGIGIGIHGKIPAGIAQMTQLRTLKMHDDRLSDVTSLAGLTNLTTLDLSWNGLDDISPLSTLTNLTKLDANDQQMKTGDYVANPDVTIPSGTVANTRQSPAITFGRSACFYYKNETKPACLDPGNVAINGDSVKLIDPHVDVPRDLPTSELGNVVNNQLRDGLVAIPFSGSITDSTGRLIGNFNGLFAPIVRAPRVVFDLRGGTLDGNANPPTRQMVYGSSLKGMHDGFRSGDTFRGWRACNTGTSNHNPTPCTFNNAPKFYVDTDLITDDMTIYAFWQSDNKHDVVFVPGANQATWTTPVPIGSIFERPARTPRNPGHAFLGWYTDPNSGVLYEFGHEIDHNFNLYAHWGPEGSAPESLAAKYTVQFDHRNGQPGTQEDVPAGNTVKQPPTPVRTGFDFKGWSTTPDEGTAYNFGNSVNSNLVLYALWTPKSSSSAQVSAPAPSSPSSQIANRYVTIQNYAAGNAGNASAANVGNAIGGGKDAVAANGNGFNLLRSNGSANDSKQQAKPDTQGGQKVCKANTISTTTPSSMRNDGTFGSVQSISDYDAQCVATAPAAAGVEHHSNLGWLWLLLLVFLLLPLLFSRDRLPNIGQHKSAEIYK